MVLLITMSMPNAPRLISNTTKGNQESTEEYVTPWLVQSKYKPRTSGVSKMRISQKLMEACLNDIETHNEAFNGLIWHHFTIATKIMNS